MNPQLNPTTITCAAIPGCGALLFPAPLPPERAEHRLYPESHPHSVKRVLRHRRTRKYYKDDGWTEHAAEARVFVDAVEAAQVCARSKLIEMELALRVETSECDLFCTPLC